MLTAFKQRHIPHAQPRAVREFFLRESGQCAVLAQNLGKGIQNRGVIINHLPDEAQKMLLHYEVFCEYALEPEEFSRRWAHLLGKDS